MRTAAVAVGVTCTFGAPIGGVLFAIEVSSSVFTVDNLWISFFASTVTVLLFKMLGKYDSQAFFTADASYFFKAEKAIGIN
jgi:chloride channel 2